ncbi:MAG: OmcA/MtrC family decaheme c-type cytochrome [Desulfuromonadales bacterium]
MKMQKLWYLIALVALTMLPLAGCGGGGSSIAQTKDGSKITIEGQLDVAALKSTDKSVALSPYSTAKASTVYIIDAQAGTVLTSGAIDASGKFSGLSFTLPSVKSILVFKAVTASGTLRTIVPIDLSNPPASGTITGNQPIVIYINSTSDAIAKSVSSSLGLTGIIGDGGQTLNSKSKTYADAQTLVTNSGGLTLAYGSSGLALSGSVGDNTLLPAWNAGSLTADDLKNIALDGKIISAFISGNQPVVNFQVTNKATGKGISGLRTFSLHVAQLKPELDGAASYWQNYIADGLPLTALPAATAAPTNPSTDAVSSFNTDGSLKGQGYAVVDKGDGSYTVTFGANIKANTKVPYDASLVHRIGITVRSVVVPGVVGKTPGAYAGPINQTTGAVMAQFLNTNGAAFVYDFIPATGAAYKDATSGSAFARDIVTIAACNQCHYRLEFGSNNTSGHMGSRPDTKICVMCHTNQLAVIATNTIGAGATVGTGNFTNFIHQIHMGEELPVAITATTQALSGAIPASEVKYPQDIRNCTFCHKGADVDHWMSKPTRNACGACHDNVNFATGVNHGIGGAKADDKACATCHDSASVKAYHVPYVTKVTNATSGVNSYYANNNALPTGAYKIEYVLGAVSVDAARKVSVKFQVKKDGTAVTFGTYNATTNPNIIPNTVGGPSIRIAFNATQDGITSPADLNASMSAPAIGMAAPTVTASTATPPSTFTPPVTTSNLWASGGTLTVNGITWTLTGPDTTGFYTITSSLPLPATTTVVTALMYGSMTQTNLAAYPFKATSIADYTVVTNATTGAKTYSLTNTGLILNAADAKASLTGTGFTARRTLVDNAKCNLCHDQLGIKPNFHGGARNDGTICNICHTPNGVNTGWSYGFNTFIHAIHGASKRTTNYTFAATAPTTGIVATDGYFKIGYPGVLKNCEQCHVSGGYDFSTVDATKLLFNTVATGTTAAATYNTAPYIAQTAGTVYGSGFSAATTTGAVVTTQAAATTLVSSPIAAACFSCHDTNTARSHMVNQGGAIYEARSTALAKQELCLVCHGALSTSNSTNTTTPAIKAVHRWW